MVEAGERSCVGRDVVADAGAVADDLEALRRAVVAAPLRLAAPPGRATSVRNLEHYLALRWRDLRPLQARLGALGLSSLGGTEANVLAAVDVTYRAACALAGRVPRPLDAGDAACAGVPGPGEGRGILAAAADRLFGPRPAGRSTRIMVTLPSEAAHDHDLLVDLVSAGVDAVRVNTAHDDPATWRSMVANVRAVQDPERPVFVMFDLPGPKVRTGRLQPGPEVVKVRPRRDRTGTVVEPARLWLAGPDAALDRVAPSHRVVPVEAALEVDRGSQLRLVDARGARRRWTVVWTDGHSTLVETDRTAYVSTGTDLWHGDRLVGRIGQVPALEQAWSLTRSDIVRLVPDDEPRDPGDHIVGCTHPEVLRWMQPGERVAFDDGRASGVVVEVSTDAVAVRITEPSGRRVSLRAGKGINLPDTALDLPVLGAGDLTALDVAVELADAVALSFVGGPDDVRLLQTQLRQRQASDQLAVVVKVETLRGFRALPEVISQVLHSERCGLMLARGDLAVEVGYERLAEVQEEVMWIAEASHLPVIWATEVLDVLARSGRPTRAEITDAAAADRAECVMLNKGAHVSEAVAMLAGILTRMDDHVVKKQALLRRLTSWAPNQPES